MKKYKILKVKIVRGSFCGGGCAATSFNVYGDIDAYQDFMCSSHRNNCLNHLRHIELEEEGFIV